MILAVGQKAIYKLKATTHCLLCDQETLRWGCDWIKVVLSFYHRIEDINIFVFSCVIISTQEASDTAEWKDKQILGLVIEAHGKTSVAKWTKREESPVTYAKGQEQEVEKE